MSLLRFLGLASTSPVSREPESLRELATRLDSLDPEEARFVAAFAYLLARVAGADLATASSERGAIAERLERVARQEPERAALLAEAAIAAAASHGASDDHLVARTFREISNDEERRTLVRCLYAVAAADQTITTVEDNEVFEIATEIGLSRIEVVALRSEWREQLAVLRALPRER